LDCGDTGEKPIVKGESKGERKEEAGWHLGVRLAYSGRAWEEESDSRRPHQGMKSPWDTPPWFQHQMLGKG
jgi:hypothetical protein